MQIVRNIPELRKATANLRKNGELLGFVPTMGYLHEGHLSLVRKLQRKTSNIVASIFVNPTQFSNPKDFEKYPIDLERDCALLEKEDVEIVFAPTTDNLYGDRSKFQSWVELTELSKPLEGRARPGHFRGVTTVVTMLFNAVQPDLAAFGEKDFQQLRQIEQMVTDLKFPIEIVRGETVRESDGLAMSSRNVRLSAAQRKSASAISYGLRYARESFRGGERDAGKLLDDVFEILEKAAIAPVDYVSLVDASTLEDVTRVEEGNRLLVACYLGEVRLIDNVEM